MSFYTVKSSLTGSEDAIKTLLGGKGAGLVRMELAGIPVPPFVVLATTLWAKYDADPVAAMAEVKADIPAMLEYLSSTFGYVPLVSVRSGAKDSMPGMMDTILNVGLNAAVLPEWENRLNEECAEDSFKRLKHMYKKVVGIDVPVSMEDQLLGAIEAVFKSWWSERAKTYRALHGISDAGGTAVVIQAMVFGNYDIKSGTGVCFSRNKITGENLMTGDFLTKGQGEDVVGGATNAAKPLSYMKEWHPGIAAQFTEVIYKLEAMYVDMVDVEFTVQDFKLYFLQVRAGKRSAQAAIKIAVDMHAEGVIDVATMIKRVSHQEYLIATRSEIDVAWKEANPAHAVGIPASNGVATGVAVFSSAAALMCKEPCILIAAFTTPDDIAGINAAVGTLTATGADTCHAAVVANGMNKVCVVGCTALKPSNQNDVWHILGSVSHIITEGTKVTLDGKTGEIWVGANPVIVNGAAAPEVQEFLNVVKSHYDVFEVVTEVDDIAGKKNVLFQSAASCGDAVKMLAALNAFNGECMVFDMRATSQLIEHGDLAFMKGLGSTALSVSMMNHAVECKKALQAFCGDRSKILVLGASIMMPTGYKQIPVVGTMDALSKVEGLCLADFVKLKAEAGEAAVKKVVEARRKAGFKIKSFNIFSVSIMPGVFNTGAVIAMSEKVLLASVLG